MSNAHCRYKTNQVLALFIVYLLVLGIKACNDTDSWCRRSSGDEMDSTLRRLSLTVQKRLKIGDSRTGKGNSGRKRPKGPPQPQSLIPQFSFPTAKHGAEGEGGFSKGGGDGGGKRGVTASLVDRVTGELIEVGGGVWFYCYWYFFVDISRSVSKNYDTAR